LAVAGGYGYLRYRFDQINKVHISAEVAAQSGQPFTILVIGSDSRVGENVKENFGSAAEVAGQRSDVVQLWRVTPATKQIQIMSIPRDTVVTMLGSDATQFGQYNRINSSFNSGANQLVKTITANFGIQINHVVQVDFAGFQGRSTLSAASTSTSTTRPRIPTPASTSPRTGCQLLRASRRSPWPGPATTSTTPGRVLAVRPDE
jgi:hypothetical protein